MIVPVLDVSAVLCPFRGNEGLTAFVNAILLLLLLVVPDAPRDIIQTKICARMEITVEMVVEFDRKGSVV